MTSHRDIVRRVLEERDAEEAANRRRYRRCPMTAHLHENYRRVCDDPACLEGHCVERVALGLNDEGEPLKRKDRPLCGAKTRSSGKCQMRVEPGKHRCRLHGGLSTGPKTREGKARVAAAVRERHAQRKLDDLPN